jgi:hypothetical protein
MLIGYGYCRIEEQRRRDDDDDRRRRDGRDGRWLVLAGGGERDE